MRDIPCMPTKQSTTPAQAATIERALMLAAAYGDADAAATLRLRVAAELAVMDPSEFEGDAESGPMVPTTSIEWGIRDARSELLRATVERGIGEYNGEVNDDVLFAIAACSGASPLYVLDCAVKAGKAPRSDRGTSAYSRTAREARISMRMRADVHARAEARDAAIAAA